MAINTRKIGAYSLTDTPTSLKPINQLSPNLLQKAIMDPLLSIRKKLALSSLALSHSRIRTQQALISQYDETELDQKFDQLVYKNLAFDSVCTEYGDSSSVSRGRFSWDGRLWVAVGASGSGKVWGVQDQWGSGFGVGVTELRGVDKMCDVDLHPQIGNIPAFAPNIIIGTAFGQILVWTFDPTLPAQKSLTLKAHSDRINSLKFHPSAPIFLSASYDKSWSIWDSTRLKQLSNQKGHSKEIHTMSLHPDGSLIFTGDLGGAGMLWDLRTGKGVYEIWESNSIVCSVFHPNGFEFAIGGKNNMIEIFDLRRKKEIKQIPAHLKLVSDLQFTENGSLLISASHDNIVKLWHGRSYCSVGNELEHPAKISSIGFAKGKLGVTMLDRKWTIWSNNRRVKDGEEDGVKMEEENS